MPKTPSCEGSTCLGWQDLELGKNLGAGATAQKSAAQVKGFLDLDIAVKKTQSPNEGSYAAVCLQQGLAIQKLLRHSNILQLVDSFSTQDLSAAGRGCGIFR